MIDEKKLLEKIDNNVPDLTSDQIYKIAEVIVKQPKVNEWIPVSERLPEGCESAEIEVLISVRALYPDAFIETSGFALYYPETKKFHSVYGDRLDITEIVTAWQYLPAPYDMRKKVE